MTSSPGECPANVLCDKLKFNVRMDLFVRLRIIAEYP
jgi:hypothetical protein